MRRHSFSIRALLRGAVALLLAAGASSTAQAATRSQLALDPLTVSLREQQSPSLFAEPLPLTLDASREGEWRLSGDTLEWRHEITVDGAVSLALEIAALDLPAGASLSIGAQHWQGPLQRHRLFTQHQPGRVLSLLARLPRGQSQAFALRLAEVQAGFREPSASAASFVAKAASACTVNAACSTDAALQQWAGAVVAITIGNSATCTGTLMNNSSGDGRPYLLTAKHCYTTTGGTDPVRAAASLRMAWNAVTPCGTPLASAWGIGTPVTEGAQHRAEYGDAWLVELNTRPPESVAPWYAGFDARDQVPSGELVGLHNGNGLQRQLLSTRSAPRLTRNVADFLGGFQLLGWGFSPQQGAAAPGASGSSLFDAEGHVIGTLSTGITCEAGTPQVTYARLAQAWAGDGSPAGSLRPWLDPTNSGQAIAGKSFSVPAIVPSVPTVPAAPSTPAAGAAGGGGGFGLPLLLGLLLAGSWRAALRRQAHHESV